MLCIYLLVVGIMGNHSVDLSENRFLMFERVQCGIRGYNSTLLEILHMSVLQPTRNRKPETENPPKETHHLNPPPNHQTNSLLVAPSLDNMWDSLSSISASKEAPEREAQEHAFGSTAAW